MIERKFDDFSSQKNYAIDQAKNNWIYILDADERISSDLESEIINTLRGSENVVAYAFYRKFYFKNTLLKFCGYQTNKVFRLFNKKYVTYNKEKLVHETLHINGKTKILTNKLDHYSYVNDNKYREKLAKYAKLRAEEFYFKKLKPTFYHYYIKPAYRFLYHFVIRLGFLDGKIGYKISRLNAFGVKQRYVELKKMYLLEKT